MSFLPAGAPAPSFTLQAAVSERPVTLRDVPGALLLVFVSYQTAAVTGDIIAAVRDRQPSPHEVLIAGVADMRPVPRLLRGAAKAMIRSAYQDAARQVPAGHDPADHIIILPDWEGALFDAYQVPATDEQAALVAVNAAKLVAGSYSGPEPVAEALRLVAFSLNGGATRSGQNNAG